MQTIRSTLHNNFKTFLKMQSGKSGIDTAKRNSQNATASKAFVKDIYQISPTVKGFTLKICDPNFTFKAGQWVDTFIPNLDRVGGFSICSPPIKYKETGCIDLGIKYTTSAPGLWFHEKCCVGSDLLLRAGGEFIYAPEAEGWSDKYDLLLVTGGVGINPIFSMYSHYAYLKRSYITGEESGDNTSRRYNPGKLSLLFTAREEDELVYKATIDSIAKSFPDQVQVKYFVTNLKSSNLMYNRRITAEVISSSLENLNKSKTKVYICGPPSLIDDVKSYALNCDVPCSQILYENWWTSD